MRPAEPDQPLACPRAPDLPGLLQGECTIREEAALEQHLLGCEPCREELDGLHAVLDALRAAPGDAPHPDLAPSILAALPSKAFAGLPTERPRLTACFGGIAAAAALLIALSLFTAEPNGQRALVSAPDQHAGAIGKGISWLVREQRPDGSWASPEGVHNREGNASLSGLCLAAITEANLDDPSIRRSVDSAVRALQRMQTAEGRLAPPGPERLGDHAIATWGLLRVYTNNPWPGLHAILSRAIEHMKDRQDQNGGWCATADMSLAARSDAARWAMQALVQARLMGWGSLNATIAKARRRYSFTPDEMTIVDDPSAAMGALLLQRQTRRGSLSGSWADAGGRLRRTALNVLTLQRAHQARSLIARAR